MSEHSHVRVYSDRFCVLVCPVCAEMGAMSVRRGRFSLIWALPTPLMRTAVLCAVHAKSCPLGLQDWRQVCVCGGGGEGEGHPRGTYPILTHAAVR